MYNFRSDYVILKLKCAVHSWLHGEVAVEKRDASEDVTAREEVSFTIKQSYKKSNSIMIVTFSSAKSIRANPLVHCSKNSCTIKQ